MTHRPTASLLNPPDPHPSSKTNKNHKIHTPHPKPTKTTRSTPRSRSTLHSLTEIELRFKINPKSTTRKIHTQSKIKRPPLILTSGGLQRWARSVRRRGIHSGGSRRSSSDLNRVEHSAADLSGIHLEDLNAVVVCGSGGNGGAERFFLDESYREQRGEHRQGTKKKGRERKKSCKMEKKNNNK